MKNLVYRSNRVFALAGDALADEVLCGNQDLIKRCSFWPMRQIDHFLCIVHFLCHKQTDRLIDQYIWHKP